MYYQFSNFRVIQQNHIFEPFFTDKSNGNGLGLAVVYRIIKDHEGGIYVNSNVGEGTSFYIFLPVTGVNIDADNKIQQPAKTVSL